MSVKRDLRFVHLRSPPLSPLDFHKGGALSLVYIYLTIASTLTPRLSLSGECDSRDIREALRSPPLSPLDFHDFPDLPLSKSLRALRSPPLSPLDFHFDCSAFAAGEISLTIASTLTPRLSRD